MMSPQLDQVIAWARHAGSILRSGLGQEHQIEHKGEIDLVTEMDHLSEDYLIGQVRAHFPQHAIVSEEAGSLAGQGSASHPVEGSASPLRRTLGVSHPVEGVEGSACWYIDPLDGTLNYAHGVPIFCVSIGYAEAGQMRLGVVYDPMQDECFSAERGRGAWLNGQSIHVGNQADLGQAFLVTGFPYDVRQTQFNNIELFGRLILRAQSVRRLGSAALDLGYIAAGRFDGYWEIRLKPWDLAAGALIVEEAGGLVTAFSGAPDYLQPPYGLIASNPVLHPALLAALASA